MPRKPLYAAFWAALLITLTACQSLGVATPRTFNERLAAAYSTVTAARNTTATLLTAGKLSPSDAQNAQSQLDTARTGLDLARQVHASDPAAAQTRLDGIVVGLATLQAYLQSRTTGEAP